MIFDESLFYPYSYTNITQTHLALLTIQNTFHTKFWKTLYKIYSPHNNFPVLSNYTREMVRLFGSTDLSKVINVTGFEPAIPARERPQIHALDREATAIGIINNFCYKIISCTMRFFEEISTKINGVTLEKV